MRYKIYKAVLHSITNSRGGFEFLDCTLFLDDVNPLSNPTRLPHFFITNEECINLYKPYVDDTTHEVNLEKLEQDVKQHKVEDILHINNIFFVDIPLKDNYIRVYEQKIEHNGELCRVKDPMITVRELRARGLI